MAAALVMGAETGPESRPGPGSGGRSPQRLEPVPESSEIVIGLLIPPEQSEAEDLRRGVALGLEQANQAAGKQARVIVRGRAGQWDADAVEAARLVTDDGVRGVISPVDGAATHLVLQVAARTAVPVVSLCPDASVCQTGVPWMVRIVPSNLDQAGALFRQFRAPSSPRSNRWAAVVPDGRAGREAGRDLEAGAKNHGFLPGRIIRSSNEHLSLARDQLLGLEPNLILLWLDPVPAAALAKSLRAAGFAGRLAGPAKLNSPVFAAEAGRAFEGFVIPGPVLTKASQARFDRFEAAYSRRFGEKPSATAAAAYDAVTLLICLSRRPGPPKPSRLFQEGDSLAGLSGTLAFDQEGNLKTALGLFEGRQGSFAPLK